MLLSQESSCSLRTFARHQQSVMSVDFHPANDDVVCSCDSDGEVRMWSVDKGTCTRVFKVGDRSPERELLYKGFPGTVIGASATLSGC